jgi:hypothetical protein
LNTVRVQELGSCDLLLIYKGSDLGAVLFIRPLTSNKYNVPHSTYVAHTADTAAVSVVQ